MPIYKTWLINCCLTSSKQYFYYIDDVKYHCLLCRFCCFSSLKSTRLLPNLTIWVLRQVCNKKQELLTLRGYLGSPKVSWWCPCCFLCCIFVCVSLLFKIEHFIMTRKGSCVCHNRIWQRVLTYNAFYTGVKIPKYIHQKIYCSCVKQWIC